MTQTELINNHIELFNSIKSSANCPDDAYEIFIAYIASNCNSFNADDNCTMQKIENMIAKFYRTTIGHIVIHLSIAAMWAIIIYTFVSAFIR